MPSFQYCKYLEYHDGRRVETGTVCLKALQIDNDELEWSILVHSGRHLGTISGYQTLHDTSFQ